MIYRILADAVVLLHLLFIVFALLGGLTVIWRKWMLAIHLPAAVWIAVIEFQGWICPLTPLEVTLRHAAGMAGYSGSFIEHYILPIIYPTGLTQEVQLVLGFAAIGINVTVYILVFYWLHRRG